MSSVTVLKSEKIQNTFLNFVRNTSYLIITLVYVLDISVALCLKSPVALHLTVYEHKDMSYVNHLN